MRDRSGVAWHARCLRACVRARDRHSRLLLAAQGRLKVVTRRDGAPPEASATPFYMLGLDLPPPPLFADVMEKNIIPQVALAACLAKFDGATEVDLLRAGRKTYALEALPPFLILHMKRFTRNNFFTEKNPTIVTFPVRNLELRDALPLPPGLASKYDLVANICHDGAARPARMFGLCLAARARCLLLLR
jgi:U4/U6.U5 tri-snRNP-associated protein 2